MSACEELPCTTGLDRKCPLCGSGRTRFGDSWSDGDEWIERGFNSQECRSCGTPCKMWDFIEKKFKNLEDALQRSTVTLDSVSVYLDGGAYKDVKHQITVNKVALGDAK